MLAVVKTKRLIRVSLANSPRISFIVKGITENLRTRDNLSIICRAHVREGERKRNHFWLNHAMICIQFDMTKVDMINPICI